MAAGFRDTLTLSGVWFPKRTIAAPGGFRSVLQLSGVWVTGKGKATPEPEPSGVSDLLVLKRRRGRR